MICKTCEGERAFELPCFHCGAAIQQPSAEEQARIDLRRIKDAEWDREYRRLRGHESQGEVRPALPAVLGAAAAVGKAAVHVAVAGLVALDEHATTCPHCREPMKRGARTCPHCGRNRH